MADNLKYEKPETLSWGEHLSNLRRKILKSSVMEPGFIDGLTDNVDAPISYDNIQSLAGSRIRQGFADPLKKAMAAIDKGMNGELLNTDDAAAITEILSEYAVGGGLLSGAGKPNKLLSLPDVRGIAKRHKKAQKNAALPKEEGGLGLPKNNTAMDRADVMFPVDGYHGTDSDFFSAFDPSHAGSSSHSQAAELAVWLAKNPHLASDFAGTKTGSRVLPLRARKIDGFGSFDLPPDPDDLWVKSNISHAQEQGYDLIELNNYSSPSGKKQEKILAAQHPNQLRSRFAAFDPFEINNPDLMASLAAILLGAGVVSGEN